MMAKGSQLIEQQCRRKGIPLLDLKPDMIAPSVAGRVNLEVAFRLRAVPVSEEDGLVTVAMADPFDAQALEALGQLLKSGVVPVYSAPAAIEEALKHLQASELENLS
jgi:hypothetical protein